MKCITRCDSKKTHPKIYPISTILIMIRKTMTGERVLKDVDSAIPTTFQTKDRVLSAEK